MKRHRAALTLPEPPSVNAYWRTWKGRMLISRDGRAYKARAGLIAEAQRVAKLDGPVVVTLDWYRSARRGDLDNRLKVALDVLKGIAYADDSQIVAITARRFEDKDNPRVEITVQAWTPAEVAA